MITFVLALSVRIFVSIQVHVLESDTSLTGDNRMLILQYFLVAEFL